MTIALDVVIGLIGLGIVIFVHELGHFVAAKLSGIDVEIFSVGWGRKLVSFTYRGTEYRLSVFPLGGYCKMKGEEYLKRALESDNSRVNPEKGSLFSAAPWKRVLTYLAGPSSNFLFSIVVLSIVWFAGFTFQSFDSRIALSSDYPTMSHLKSYPADAAGLQSGDWIVGVDGKKVSNFQDLQDDIAPNPGKPVVLTVRRGDALLSVQTTPILDTSTGAGVIGVTEWVDPVIDSVAKDSAAAKAGLEAGDRIATAAGKPIRNTVDFFSLLNDKPTSLPVTYRRNGELRETTLSPKYSNTAEPAGISFPLLTVHSAPVGPLGAIGKGTAETVKTLNLTVKGIGLLFRGVNIVSAVSGPIRITYYVGEVTQAGFKFGIGEGLASLFRFLCILSVALFFMNLLPLPALDGGLILLSLIEMITGRSTRPQVFYRFQMVGFAIIFGLIILSTFSDVSFFIGK